MLDLRRFLTGDSGQDLTEYTLLIAFIALLGASVFIAAGGANGDIWSTANTRLVAASAVAKGDAPATASAPAPPTHHDDDDHH